MLLGMKEDFPRPPSASDMRTEVYESENKRRRELVKQVYDHLQQLDQDKEANPELDQTGERAILNATLTALEQQQGKADALYESGR